MKNLGGIAPDTLELGTLKWSKIASPKVLPDMLSTLLRYLSCGKTSSFVLQFLPPPH